MALSDRWEEPVTIQFYLKKNDDERQADLKGKEHIKKCLKTDRTVNLNENDQIKDVI